MFGYRSNVPKVRLTTDRLVVRLVHDRDAWRLASGGLLRRESPFPQALGASARRKPLLSIRLAGQARDD